MPEVGVSEEGVYCKMQDRWRVCGWKVESRLLKRINTEAKATVYNYMTTLLNLCYCVLYNTPAHTLLVYNIMSLFPLGIVL